MFCFVMLVVQCAFAQDRTITGTVTDNKQEPLIGVNVVVKGNTSVGAITDLNGKYSLSVPEGESYPRFLLYRICYTGSICGFAEYSGCGVGR